MELKVVGRIDYPQVGTRVDLKQDIYNAVIGNNGRSVDMHTLHLESEHLLQQFEKHVADLDLSIRCLNALKHNGIVTWRDLYTCHLSVVDGKHLLNHFNKVTPKVYEELLETIKLLKSKI